MNLDNLRYRKCTIILTLIFFLIITGCGEKSKKSSFDINSVQSYRNIPGVTDEEIAAIETLKSERKSFSFGMVPSTEVFAMPDGRYTGFSVEFCGLLSCLFDIPFVLDLYNWDTLKNGIDSGAIDFIGEVTPTPERRRFYYMTHPIAERPLGVFTYGNSVNIKKESDLNGLRIGFLENSITAQFILNMYPLLEFEIVDIQNTGDVVDKFKSGIIDAYIVDANSSYEFINYPDIHSKVLFPLVYTPVSMTAANPELQPVISVMNKYIEAGGIDILNELYRTSNHEYAKYELGRSFTIEERTYLNGLSAKRSKVPIAMEPTNYPISFYNERDKEFQGIALDILSEVSSLTGIEFEVAITKDMKWPEILEKLKTGEVSLVTELFHTDERKNVFLWTDKPYATSHYALLSKSDYPNLEMYQVRRATVGVVAGSAYEDVYNTWFPNNTNVRHYYNHNEALVALERDEIDLLMTSENILLSQINYREKPEYKANIISGALATESFFGLNKNEDQLCSIICKAQNYVNTDAIVRNWTSRVYDYSRKFADERSKYLFIFAVMLFSFLAVLIVLLIRVNQTRKLYKNQMTTISGIYRSLPNLVFSKDINGRYTSCNVALEGLTGRPESEIIGKTPVEVYAHDKEMAEKFMVRDKKTINENSERKAEEWLTYPDQSRRLFEIVSTPLIQDDGTVIGSLGIGTDITEYKAAEKAAQEALKQKDSVLYTLENILNNLETMIYINDPDTCEILFMNDIMRQHFGIEGDGIGQICYKVLQSGMNERCDFCPCYQLNKEPDKVVVWEKSNSLTNRIYRNVNRYINWLGGKTVHFMQSIDVTDFITAREMAEAASYAKSTFLTKMSHEMRTPLNAVIGLSELILEVGGIDEETYSNLEKIYNAGSTLLSTVNDILDISKVEAGKLELVEAEYDVPSMINDTVAQSVMHIGEKPVAFKLDVNEDLPTRLYGDELRVKQVLNNLLSNACKYTREGFVELTICCTREDDAVWILASVRDTGIGIKPEETKNLFSDYSQIDVMSNHKIEGTGLGLSITEKIAALMDGSINVTSEYGKGSVFTVKLKQKYVSDSAIGSEVVNSLRNFHYSTARRDENSKLIRISLPYAHVLVVDDNRTNLDVAKGIFRLYRIKTDCVQSGQLAIDAVREEKVKYNAIFMDHMMPGMDGIEATRIIREEIGTEYAKTIPIIALTANAITGNEELFLSKGFQAFISKPVEIARLDTVIREWVRDKEQEKLLTDKQILPYTRSGQDRRSGIDRRSNSGNRRTTDRRIVGSMNIAGIDVDKGIKHFDGNETLYFTMLRSFAVNTRPLLETIKEVSRDSLADYAITVHGIKGSSYGIYADITGSGAEALEKAAKAGDFDFVSANNNAFIETAEKLLDDIENLLGGIAVNPKPKKEKPDLELLAIILNACKNYDIEKIDAAMAKIDSYEYESDDGLAVWLRDNVDHLDYEQIAERLSSLLNKTEI
ncbi:MAG: transporter substrate-binding domain-containing protein [Treponema sp.]|nr:transporter substrate-binding domain-containing protein [Treponema sp.]